MAPLNADQEWYSIAEQASKEMEPKKLSVLVEQLCTALDKRDRQRREMYGSARVITPLPGNPASFRDTCL